MELCGIPHSIVQKILGHSPQDITGRHYIAATPETIREVAERLDARTRQLSSDGAARNEVTRPIGITGTESQLIN